jgi:hypothetical protein
MAAQGAATSRRALARSFAQAASRSRPSSSGLSGWGVSAGIWSSWVVVVELVLGVAVGASAPEPQAVSPKAVLRARGINP